MATIISIALQKGGSAKTTTSVNLATNLNAQRKNVLLIDMDAQANATFASGVNSKSLDNSLYNLLTSDAQYKCHADGAILKLKHYDFIPADRDVADLTNELKSPVILKSVLAAISDRYDYIIIDTPPALNIITINAFTASDYIIIPAEPKPFHFTGLKDLEDTISEIRKNWNPALKVLGILLVKYNGRTNLNRQMKELIESYASTLQTTCFVSTIREGIAVAESQLMQQPLIEYSSSSKPSVDYIAFTSEVLNLLGDN